ncbi:MAG: adenosylcobinamide-GDP ribazoletransferase [Firmicutes bacterium]|nr:adenosylcobinamide-GDP ribazoletransferase [Bacillota bacterium]
MDNKNIKDFKSALAFLTAFPIQDSKPSPDALNWFPVVGMLAGGAEGLIYNASKRFFSKQIASIITVLADILITSGMHLDGLADTADGLFAHAPLKSRLEIMKAPDIGTYGQAAIFIALATKTAVLSEDKTDIFDLMLAMASSRELAHLVIKKYNYVREHGLVEVLINPENHPEAVSETIPVAPDPALVKEEVENHKSTSEVSGVLSSLSLFVLALVILVFRKSGRIIFLRSCLSALVALVASYGLLRHGKSKIGGYTGDILGASITLYEIVYLLVNNLYNTDKKSNSRNRLSRVLLPGAVGEK